MQFVSQHIIQTARIKLWTHLYSLLVKGMLKKISIKQEKNLNILFLIIVLTSMSSV